MSLRGLVTALHRKHGLSQTEIARRAGLSQGLIYKLLAGLGTPQMRTYKRLIAAFPEEWSDHLKHHPSARREFHHTFGWALRTEPEHDTWRRNIRALLEAELDASDLEELPNHLKQQYRRKARQIVGEALRELARYRDNLHRDATSPKSRLPK